MGAPEDKNSIYAALASIFDCTEETCAEIAPYFRIRRLRRQETLLHQGKEGEKCWIILDGALAVSVFGEDGQEAQLVSYGPGEISGAFPTPGEQRGNLVALAACELIEVKTVHLLAISEREAPVGRSLAMLIGRQHDALLDRLANRMILSAGGRVYAELLRLADGEGRISPPPVISALALRVHTARETASRAVAAAERRGLVERGDTAWRIVAPGRLKALAV
ncbi:hypothetical protein B5C34_13390 [Pacificimonas flava]|uniref:Cyclic nucleotide-binding domain-containing protein n=2 Tax=Pacificimonas TaxID=1960290 RepID=A0A219B7H9_9SPHN|nr:MULTISPECIES: Crp/Fnr family transcriptional regulator [Pacificimonas]MBZ6379817.1 Crp/Fnr family transcriptional regulator [Pacificimonas aurantium]OWV34352.1 hypothetical protein B5C34_13390 [Pacificimonas flava]